jgi:hypothetical protein
MGVQPIQRKLGWQGGGGVFNVYWLNKQGFWCVLEPALTENRYWCAFGVDNPHNTENLTITCEINPPFSGVNRRMAGAFARDSCGGLSIAHSGKVGGGRKGIGQAAFLSLCHCAAAPVTFADGITTEMLIVGALTSKKLRAEIAYFIREVERIKPMLVKAADAKNGAKGDKFAPEFSGKKKAFLVVGQVEAIATHGLVVGALADALEALSLAPHSDQQRDLFLGPGGAPTHLFEIKTDFTPYSIYTGVGQLMLHGVAKSASPVRVLVIPGTPSGSLGAQVNALKVRMLTYSWEGDKPVIKNLIPVPLKIDHISRGANRLQHRAAA